MGESRGMGWVGGCERESVYVLERLGEDSTTLDGYEAREERNSNNNRDRDKRNQQN